MPAICGRLNSLGAIRAERLVVSGSANGLQPLRTVANYARPKSLVPSRSSLD